MSEEDTIVALATPSGESAIALIRLSGSACDALARSVFERTTSPTPRRASLGNYTAKGGTVLDQVLYTYFAEGASYTGEPMLELATHGNPLIVRKVLEDLLARGCRMAQAGEFTRRAFTGGKLDLSQAEAVAELIAARSERALAAAHKRLTGALGARMDDFCSRLLGVLAHFEAYIDFPEEDMPPEDEAGPVANLRSLLEDVRRLCETGRYHDLTHSGIKTLIVGAPNAGKSSLLNALVGQDRVIVSPEAGTTRDFISERMMLGPHAVQIIDTAGLRKAESAIEQAGVDKTLEKMREADFFLYVIDAAAASPTLPEESLALFHVEQTLVIENKSDLPEAQKHDDVLPGRPRVRISAKTGMGLGELKDTWIRTLEKDLQLPSSDELTVSARHAEALDKAAEALEAALGKQRSAEPTELICCDLRDALTAFGDVVGRIDNERMLDQLFANFCIGK